MGGNLVRALEAQEYQMRALVGSHDSSLTLQNTIEGALEKAVRWFRDYVLV